MLRMCVKKIPYYTHEVGDNFVLYSLFVINYRIIHIKLCIIHRGFACQKGMYQNIVF